MLLLLYICKQEWVVTMQKCSNYYYRLRCMFVWHRCFKLLTREKRTYVSVCILLDGMKSVTTGKIDMGKIEMQDLNARVQI